MTAELMRTFQDAGLDADHDPKGLSDRGLYVARALLARRNLEQGEES
jgi:hypothetical protein